MSEKINKFDKINLFGIKLAQIGAYVIAGVSVGTVIDVEFLPNHTVIDVIVALVCAVIGGLIGFVISYFNIKHLKSQFE